MRLNSGSSSWTTCIHRLLAHSTLLCCRNRISLHNHHPSPSDIPSCMRHSPWSCDNDEWLRSADERVISMHMQGILSSSPVGRCCLGLHHCQDVIWGAFPFPLPRLQCSWRPSAGSDHRALHAAHCRVAIMASRLLAASGTCVLRP